MKTMKNALVIVNIGLIIITVVLPFNIEAQEESKEKKVRFGLGASFLSLGERAFEHDSGQAASFHFNIDIGKHIRIEPAFAGSFFSEDNYLRPIWEPQPPTYMNTSLGLFYRNQRTVGKSDIADFIMVYGSRFGASFEEYAETKWIIAPTVAGELLLFDHFSLGCDLSIRNVFEEQGIRGYTNAMLLVRFYF